MFKLDRNSIYALLLAAMALVMLPACSSTEESSDDSSSCSERYSNEVDIRECELRENTP